MSRRVRSLPGLTVQRRDPLFAMQSRLTGTLQINFSTNCLVVRTGATSIDVAWPPGWTVAIRDGDVVLVDADGHTAGRVGDEVAVGGGSIDAATADVVPCTGRTEVFVASGLSSP